MTTLSSHHWQSHQGAVVYGGAVPKGYKPPRDRRVQVRLVVCPTCQAEVGAPCLSPTGKVTNHNPRRIMALRLERGELT